MPVTGWHQAPPSHVEHRGVPRNYLGDTDHRALGPAWGSDKLRPCLVQDRAIGRPVLEIANSVLNSGEAGEKG